MRCPGSAAAAVAALTMVTATGLAGTTQYQIVDLGDPAPNGCFCRSKAVNAAREVAGIFFGADGDYNGFVATGGVPCGRVSCGPRASGGRTCTR